MSTLTFQQLRGANIQRLLASAYKECEENWTLADWITALVGEVGEAANIIKKVRRGDFPIGMQLPALAKELADIQCYLDILAFKLGVDLGEATIQKFNEVSDRIGSPVKLGVAEDESSHMVQVKFAHDMEDGWYVGKYMFGGEVATATCSDFASLKADILKYKPNAKFNWSTENPKAFDHYCPPELRRPGINGYTPSDLLVKKDQDDLAAKKALRP